MVDYDLSDNALVGIVTLALEGIPHLRLSVSGRSVSDMLSRRGRPVRLEREGDSVAVDLQLSVDYGPAIPDLAREVQRSIAEALQASTGLRVKAVNVQVVSVEYREATNAS